MIEKHVSVHTTIPKYTAPPQEKVRTVEKKQTVACVQLAWSALPAASQQQYETLWQAATHWQLHVLTQGAVNTAANHENKCFRAWTDFHSIVGSDVEGQPISKSTKCECTRTSVITLLV